MEKQQRVLGLPKEKLISYDMISLLALIAIGILILSPVALGIYGCFKKSYNMIQAHYVVLMQNVLFPTVCVIAFILYILNLLYIKKKNMRLKDVLVENPLIIVFSVVVLLIIVSQVYNGLGYALEGFLELTLGESFDVEVGYFIFFLFAATQVRREKHKRLLIRVHLFASAFIVFTGFVLWHAKVGTEEIFYINSNGFTSIYYNLNYYGYYLAVSVPLAAAAFLYEKKNVWKAIAGISFVANTVALSINNCTGAWVGATAGMLFILVTHLIIEKKVNYQALLLLLVYAVTIFIPGHILGTFEDNLFSLGGDITKILEGTEDAGGAGSGRWDIWTGSINVIKEHKLFGIGFEGVYYNMPKYHHLALNLRPHNEFIQYALFHGIPMMVAYFIGCLGVFIRALRKRKIMDGATLVSLSAAFGYLVSSFFGLTVFSTAFYLFVFLGMGYVHEKADINDDTV